MFKSNLITAILASALTAFLVFAGPVAAREVGALVGAPAAPAATTQTMVPIQVRLQSSTGAPVNGLTSLSFCLYGVPSGGSPLFCEGGSTNVVDGLASWQLGSVGALSRTYFYGTVYVGVTVGAEAEMTPRILLGSAPVAMSVPDKSILPRKLVSVASSASSAVVVANTTPGLYQQMVPLTVVINSAYVPFPTAALILFDARCVLGVGGSGLYVELMLDGSTINHSYTNPAVGSWSDISLHALVTLGASVTHVASVRWGTGGGNSDCVDRKLTVVPLGTVP